MSSNIWLDKYLDIFRKGSRYGHDTIVDGLLKDGLWDVYNNYAMGMCAELCSDLHSITREEQVENLERADEVSCVLIFCLHGQFYFFVSASCLMYGLCYRSTIIMLYWNKHDRGRSWF